MGQRCVREFQGVIVNQVRRAQLKPNKDIHQHHLFSLSLSTAEIHESEIQITQLAATDGEFIDSTRKKKDLTSDPPPAILISDHRRRSGSVEISRSRNFAIGVSDSCTRRLIRRNFNEQGNFLACDSKKHQLTRRRSQIAISR